MSNSTPGVQSRAAFSFVAALMPVRWATAAMLALASVAVSATGADVPARAAIASAHPLATEAGYKMLQQGGNAFDAAVTVAAVLGVVEPYSAGLGGGGFWLLHRAADKFEVMVDARETAPAAITNSLYVDENGVPVPGATLTGGKAAGMFQH
ncbi:MAG: gamma-glutamyltransferase [Proteobacteria bacterium]|nr:gamma-glutamyltransferase [Pseudomonadota bacterium]